MSTKKNVQVNNKVQNEKIEQVHNKNFSAKEILSEVEELTEGLLSTAKGTKRTVKFNTEVFAGCTYEEKKTLRRKFRNILLSFADSIKNKNDTKLINAFRVFYKKTYQINDYSLRSVCNENLHEDKKKKVQKLLEICKE